MSSRNELLQIMLVVGLLKIMLLWIDPGVRFFLGDSETYLWSAISGEVPADRSWLYPRFIHYAVLPTGNIHMLAWTQTVGGLALAMLTFWLLRKCLGAKRWLAWLATLLVALGPEELFYERMMMAEALSLLALAAMLCCGVAYLRSGKWRWLLGVALFGIVAVALRVSLLPVVFGFVPLPPLVRALCISPGKSEVRHEAGGLLVSIVLAVVAHQGYLAHQRHLLPAWEPGYVGTDGYFQLGWLAPIVKEEHLEGLDLPPDFARQLPPNWREPHLRNFNLWDQNGIVSQLKKVYGVEKGNAVARTIAKRALHDDPGGVFRLSWWTLADYFDPDMVAERRDSDVAITPLSKNMLGMLRTSFHLDASRAHDASSPATRFFSTSTYWQVFCLFALFPLSLLLIGLSAWRRNATGLLIGLTAAGTTASIMLFSHIISIRYLHPLPWFFWLVIGALIAIGLDGRARQKSTEHLGS